MVTIGLSQTTQAEQIEIEQLFMSTEEGIELDTFVLFDPNTFKESFYVVKNSQQNNLFKAFINAYEEGVRVKPDPRLEDVSRVVLISKSGVIDLAKPNKSADDTIDIKVSEGEYKVYVQQGDQIVYARVLVE